MSPLTSIPPALHKARARQGALIVAPGTPVAAVSYQIVRPYARIFHERDEAGEGAGGRAARNPVSLNEDYAAEKNRSVWVQ